MITYTDQNNNTFSISRSEVVFRAITPGQSSSGTYSGGTDKRVKITSSDFKLLGKLAFEVMENDESHAPKREMLTSVLWIKIKGETKKAILYPSPLRTQFEKVMHKISGLDH